MRMVQNAVVNYSLHGCSRMAAALAYYTLFSIFPLLLILLALLGLALPFLSNLPIPIHTGTLTARGYLFTVVAANTSADLAKWLEDRLQEVETLRSAGGLLGLVVLLYGASGVFNQLDEAFNEIWGLPVPNHGPLRAFLELLRRRFLAFLMVLGLGLIAIVVLALSATLRTMAELTAVLPYSTSFWQLVSVLIVPALNWLILILVFKVMPDTNVAWGDVWLAAAVTTALLEAARRIFFWYIGVFGVANAYGAIGNVVVFVLLIYFAAQIVFLGGEISASYARYFGSRTIPQPKYPLQPLRLRRHRSKARRQRRPTPSASEHSR